jgi:hypothetical protein
MIYDRIDDHGFLEEIIQLMLGCLCFCLTGVSGFTLWEAGRSARWASGHFLDIVVALSHRTTAFASIALVDRPISTVLILQRKLWTVSAVRALGGKSPYMAKSVGICTKTKLMVCEKTYLLKLVHVKWPWCVDFSGKCMRWVFKVGSVVKCDSPAFIEIENSPCTNNSFSFFNHITMWRERCRRTWTARTKFVQPSGYGSGYCACGVIFSFKEPPIRKKINGKKYLSLDRMHNLMRMVSGKGCSSLLSGACEIGGFMGFDEWISWDSYRE